MALDEAAAEVVIIGSGPAGVSAAWPLVRAGRRVLMLDAGGAAALPVSPSGRIGDLRRGPEYADALFGGQPAVLTDAAARSPKLATPLARAVTAGFDDAFELGTRGFFATGSLAAGGLSNIWGAALARFGDSDLARFPCPAEAMRESYANVDQRLGAWVQPRMAEPVRQVFARHRRVADDLTLEPAMNAVLADDLDGRQGCNQCGLCLWGCHRGSIYNSAYELAALRQFPGFAYRSGHFVRAVAAEGDGHRIEFAGGLDSIVASTVVLAAGTIATTALVLRRLGAFGRAVRLFSNPLAALAFIVPGQFGAGLGEGGFSLGQLQYRMPLAGGGRVAGLLYGADTLPLSSVADRLPFSRPVALRFARALAPALVIATLYLPGALSRGCIRLEEGGLFIEAEQPVETVAALNASGRRLARSLRRRGAYLLPGSLTVAEPGSDVHYAGTLPMGGQGDFGCSPDGAVNQCSGLYVVDGACLPVLPAEHCTLTIMANADRIGRRLAERGDLGR